MAYSIKLKQDNITLPKQYLTSDNDWQTCSFAVMPSSVAPRWKEKVEADKIADTINALQIESCEVVENFS